MDTPKKPSLMSLLRPYLGILIFLGIFTLASNALNLLLPIITSRAIDAYGAHQLVLSTIIEEFFFAALFIFIFVYLQSILQTFASERVARDLRKRLSSKISQQATHISRRRIPLSF
jgi:ATP-binding cassette subfamily B protein